MVSKEAVAGGKVVDDKKNEEEKRLGLLGNVITVDNYYDVLDHRLVSDYDYIVKVETMQRLSLRATIPTIPIRFEQSEKCGEYRTKVCPDTFTGNMSKEINRLIGNPFIQVWIHNLQSGNFHLELLRQF